MSENTWWVLTYNSTMSAFIRQAGLIVDEFNAPR
jgi:hypothetical protein